MKNKFIGVVFAIFLLLLSACGKKQPPPPEDTNLGSTETLHAQSVEEINIKLAVGSPNAIVANTKIMIDPENIKVTPILYNNRAMVPFLFIASNLGLESEWDDIAQTTTLSKPGFKIRLTVGKSEVVVNGNSKFLDSPPLIYEGWTYLPVRFISEIMPCSVLWNEALQEVIITPLEKYADILENAPAQVLNISEYNKYSGKSVSCERVIELLTKNITNIHGCLNNTNYDNGFVDTDMSVSLYVDKIANGVYLNDIYNFAGLLKNNETYRVIVEEGVSREGDKLIIFKIYSNGNKQSTIIRESNYGSEPLKEPLKELILIANSVKATADGEDIEIYTSSKPILENKKPLIPLVLIWEKFETGGNFSYNKINGDFSCKILGSDMEGNVKKHTVTYNSKEIKEGNLFYKGDTIDGNLYATQELLEQIGFNVDYDKSTKKITITVK